MSNAMPEGSLLLQDLRHVRDDYLMPIDDKETEFWNLEQGIRVNDSLAGYYRSCRVSMAFGIGVTAACVLALLAKETDLLSAAIIPVVYWVAYMNDAKFVTRALDCGFIIAILSGILEIGAVTYCTIPAAIIGIFAAWKYAGAKVSALSATNAQYARRQQDLAYQVNAMTNAMVSETGSWYPKDYYSLWAIGHFIGFLENHQATTVCEMVRLADTARYREQMLANVNEVQARLDQVIQNQQEMTNVLYMTNVLLTSNLVANIAAANASERVANAVGA